MEISILIEFIDDIRNPCSKSISVPVFQEEYIVLVAINSEFIGNSKRYKIQNIKTMNNVEESNKKYKKWIGSPENHVDIIHRCTINNIKYNFRKGFSTLCTSYPLPLHSTKEKNSRFGFEWTKVLDVIRKLQFSQSSPLTFAFSESQID